MTTVIAMAEREQAEDDPSRPPCSSASRATAARASATWSSTAARRAARSTTTSPAARRSSPARPCATPPTSSPRRIERATGDGDPVAALRAYVGGWRRTLERSDFRAGCPIVAVAVEAPERARARRGGRRGLRALGADVRQGPARRREWARARAARLATLTVSSIEGAVVLCRARRDAGAARRRGPRARGGHRSRAAIGWRGHGPQAHPAGRGRRPRRLRRDGGRHAPRAARRGDRGRRAVCGVEPLPAPVRLARRRARHR